MATALASLISGRPVANDVAMTGEITLTGQVLPIGGLKEKSLAAQRAGIKRVIVPERNKGDVAEIPEHELGDLEFVYAEEIAESGTGRGGSACAHSALAGTAMVPVAYAAAATLSRKRVGLIAALLVAVNPAFFWYSQQAAPTSWWRSWSPSGSSSSPRR